MCNFNFKVPMPSTGKLVFDMICGVGDALRCSPTKWFTYMGDAANKLYVPFQITYVQHQTNTTDNGITPLNPKTTPCHQAVNVSRILNSWNESV